MIFQLLLFSICLSSVFSIQCGRKSIIAEDLITARIIGGKRASSGSWPWLAALATPVLLDGDSTRIRPHFKCGGSLITNLHILTAAHCTTEKLYLARLGSNTIHTLTSTTLDVPIDHVLVHGDFNLFQAYNDIAIVILRKRVIFTDRIRPICLPNKEFFISSPHENLTALIAGWGDVTYGAERGSNKLRELQLSVFSLEKCKEIYERFHTNITENNICVKSGSGEKDACQGDSGGPLMIRKPQGKSYHVVGIISHGLGCGLRGVPGVCTRVSSYLPWINGVVSRKHRGKSRIYKKKIDKVVDSNPSVSVHKRHKSSENRWGLNEASVI